MSKVLSATERELIEAHVPLADRCARIRKYPSEDLADVRSDALWGLTSAARTYRPGATPFRVYASSRMDYAIRRGRQIRSGLSRPEWEAGARLPALSLELPIHPNSPDTLMDSLVAEEKRELGLDLAIAQARTALPPHERRVLALVIDRKLSQDQAAARLGISQMHVSRTYRSAVAHLRERLGVGRSAVERSRNA